MLLEMWKKKYNINK